MKKLLAFVALVLATLNPLAAFAQDAGGVSDFDITNYSVVTDVLASGRVHVEENIDVHFFTERHGIFRNIPVDYKNASGNNFGLRVNITDVEQDGNAATYTLENSGSDLVIKIGDPDVLVKDDVKYLIAYDVDRALLATDATDELYWNVTGTEWPIVPKSVHAVVKLPSGVDTSKIEYSCYTGDAGSTLSECEKAVKSDGDGARVEFSSHDFLTVAVRIPSGLVARPTLTQKILWFISDNKVTFLPVFLFLALYWYWLRNGRDPKVRAIVTQFDAPQGMSPAEMGVLEDGKVDDRELSATIVDLAVRGYIKIIETDKKGVFGASKGFIIERTEKSLEDLRDHEELILTTLMGNAKSRDLSLLSTRAKDIKAGRELATQMLYSEMAHQKWFVGNPDKIRGTFSGIAIVLVIFAFWFVSGISLAWMVSLIACAVIIFVFGIYMPKRTEEGTRLYEQVMGFKSYLSKAEQYRLKWQETENVFEKFLPYAMVFMVVDKWTSALADTIRQPDWYQSSTPGAWNVYAFNSSLMDLNNSLNSAVMTSPKSASSGGSGISGGFSGGGFGGGGGGSW
jgi:uncharacterized membrane protein